ncbi:hypothetical protein V1478_018318 [Vespula squamosa]|uniref:Uncharacterized protein n=1 Tax=Vespula squamosa TaxID=30214 RepID=A0ABD1ZUR1_VESSQ
MQSGTTHGSDIPSSGGDSRSFHLSMERLARRLKTFHSKHAMQIPTAGASRRFEVMSTFALRNGARDRGVVTWNFDPGIERIKSTRSYRNAEKQLLSLSSETLMQPRNIILYNHFIIKV